MEALTFPIPCPASPNRLISFSSSFPHHHLHNYQPPSPTIGVSAVAPFLGTFDGAAASKPGGGDAHSHSNAAAAAATDDDDSFEFPATGSFRNSLTSADELFYNGRLLPLQLPPRKDEDFVDPPFTAADGVGREDVSRHEEEPCHRRTRSLEPMGTSKWVHNPRMVSSQRDPAEKATPPSEQQLSVRGLGKQGQINSTVASSGEIDGIRLRDAGAGRKRAKKQKSKSFQSRTSPPESSTAADAKDDKPAGDHQRAPIYSFSSTTREEADCKMQVTRKSSQLTSQRPSLLSACLGFGSRSR